MSRWRARVTAVLAILALYGVAPAEAQSASKVTRIGLMSVGSDPARPNAPQWIAFIESMRALGYVEGQNMAVERRFAGGKPERLADFAADLVGRRST